MSFQLKNHTSPHLFFPSYLNSKKQLSHFNLYFSLSMSMTVFGYLQCFVVIFIHLYIILFLIFIELNLCIFVCISYHISNFSSQFHDMVLFSSFLKFTALRGNLAKKVGFIHVILLKGSHVKSLDSMYPLTIKTIEVLELIFYGKLFVLDKSI